MMLVSGPAIGSLRTPPHQTALWFSLPRSRACHQQRESYSEVGHGAEALHRGLSFSTSDERLRELFAAAGTVESAAVVTDRDTGRSRGFGFVEMSTAEEAAEAVKKFNGQEVDGRTLKVELANPSGSGGGRSGGGYRSGGGGGNRGGGGGGRW